MFSSVRSLSTQVTVEPIEQHPAKEKEPQKVNKAQKERDINGGKNKREWAGIH